jgi:hypothetical protein
LKPLALVGSTPLNFLIFQSFNFLIKNIHVRKKSNIKNYIAKYNNNFYLIDFYFSDCKSQNKFEKYFNKSNSNKRKHKSEFRFIWFSELINFTYQQ